MNRKIIQIVRLNKRFFSLKHNRPFIYNPHYNRAFCLNKMPVSLFSENEKFNPKNNTKINGINNNYNSSSTERKHKSPSNLSEEHQLVEETKSKEGKKIKQAKRNLKKNMKRKEPENTIEITTVKKKKTVWEKVKHELQHLKKSFKDIYTDAKYIIRLRREKGRLDNFTMAEFIKYKSISYDLIKFFPYSIFLAVPILEVLLPFYILLFPNSTPSQFYSEKSIGVRTEKMTLKQTKGYKALTKRLYSVFGQDYMEIKQVVSILKENPDNIEMKEKLIQLDKLLQDKLIKEWEKNFSKKLKYSSLTIEEKEALLRVFYIEYISGLYIINQIYNFPFYIYNFTTRWTKYQKVKVKEDSWKLNFFPLTLLKSISFRIQLLNHLRRIRQEDDLLFKNDCKSLEDCASIELFELAKRRGQQIQSDTDAKLFIKTQWSHHSSITNSDLKIWSVLLRHEHADFLI